MRLRTFFFFFFFFGLRFKCIFLGRILPSVLPDLQPHWFCFENLFGVFSEPSSFLGLQLVIQNVFERTGLEEKRRRRSYICLILALGPLETTALD